MTFVIFAGTTGFEKSKYLEKLRNECLVRNGYKGSSSDSSKFIKYIKFEDHLTKTSKSNNIQTFLKRHSAQQKFRFVEETFERISQELSKEKPNNVFFNIHLSYYSSSSFFPPFQKTLYESAVKSINDNRIVVITLIDDIFVIWKYLLSKIVDFPETDLRLREIVSWRSLEILQAESVARNLTSEDVPVDDFLVAIRHPVDTFYNLIFRPNPIVGYLSYPITRTRTNPDYMKDINEFRAQAHKIVSSKYGVLLDPTTIDELALQNALKRSGSNDEVVLEESDRWALEPHPFIDDSRLWPVKIPKSQVEEVQPDVTNNIRARDFKLIDTCQTVIAYRPLLGGPSTGVKAELDYAVEEGKATLVYDPDSKETQGGHHPFGQDIRAIRNKEEFLGKIEHTFS